MNNRGTTEADLTPEDFKAYRLRSQLTQAELSEISGIPIPTIKSWEQGIAYPFASTLRKFLLTCQVQIQRVEAQEAFFKSKMEKK